MFQSQYKTNTGRYLLQWIYEYYPSTSIFLSRMGTAGEHSLAFRAFRAYRELTQSKETPTWTSIQLQALKQTKEFPLALYFHPQKEEGENTPASSCSDPNTEAGCAFGTQKTQ